ncbi:MAG: hypothetical protein HY720_16725 [Planctomycetes bacterium]|nr:hypothetical protein [Planctomycetota bacterium]
MNAENQDAGGVDVEAAGSTPLAFDAADFRLLDPEHARSRDHNKPRLALKRKLALFGKEVLPRLSAAGLALRARTSLHHPYTYNKFRVDSMWVYFSRRLEELAGLRERLGPVGEDLDPHFSQLLLLVEANAEGIVVSLKIHPGAWWEGHNLKAKCARPELRREFHALVKAVPGFSLRLHDHRKEYPCGTLYADELANLLSRYSPGEHWLHLESRFAAEEVARAGAEVRAPLQAELLRLVPLFRWIGWRPDNDFLFEKKT